MMSSPKHNLLLALFYVQL